MDNIFIGRQPILNRKQEVVAYELLFRKNFENRAIIENEIQAMSRTIVNTLVNFGTETLLGKHLGFLNVNDEFILSESIELISPDKFIFEILENSNVSDKLIERISELKQKGYRFALDDLVFEDWYMKKFSVLFNYVDIIKLDYLLIEKQELIKIFPHFKKLPVQFLAEKIEEVEDFELCLELGFDMFQGYYFEKPVVLKEKSYDPNKMSILNLINLINNNADIHEIENELKLNPDLSFNLIKFINSGAFFLASNIKSVSHAITILGMNKLLNWLLLLSYADPKQGGTKNALFQSALYRAKATEELVKQSSSSQLAKKADSAFFIGLLSLIDTIFQQPMDSILEELHLDTEVYNAITKYEGFLGKNLQLVISNEINDIDTVNKLLKDLSIKISDYNKIQLTTFEWINSF